jgi:hypothetical protein
MPNNKITNQWFKHYTLSALETVYNGTLFRLSYEIFRICHVKIFKKSNPFHNLFIGGTLGVIWMYNSGTYEIAKYFLSYFISSQAKRVHDLAAQSSDRRLVNFAQLVGPAALAKIFLLLFLLLEIAFIIDAYEGFKKFLGLLATSILLKYDLFFIGFFELDNPDDVFLMNLFLSVMGQSTGEKLTHHFFGTIQQDALVCQQAAHVAITEASKVGITNLTATYPNFWGLFSIPTIKSAAPSELLFTGVDGDGQNFSHTFECDSSPKLVGFV